MGIYRLILAVMVLLSHAGITFAGYNEGVAAVVSFYLLSGFVMTALVAKHYASLERLPFFLLDRAARIGPQYYLWLAVSVGALAAFRPPSQAGTVVDAWGLLAHLCVVPLDVFMYLLPHRTYMPQAWSLGAEALFYAAFPFILLLRARRAAAAASLGVFLIAVSGRIDTDIFGYRLLPGTLFIFLLGSFIYDGRGGRAPRWLAAAWLAAFALFAAAGLTGRLALPYNKEVIAGLLIGLPAVWCLRRQPSGRLDALAGNLSYGVFLSHNAVIFALQGRGVDVAQPGWAAAVVLACCGLAYLSYALVEEPFLRLRRSLRAAPGPGRLQAEAPSS